MEVDALLVKYVELKRTMRELEAEIESLNEVIYAQVEGAGGKLAGSDYTIACRRRPNYRFSELHQRKHADIDHLRGQLKQLEQHEIGSGVAHVESFTNIVTVRFD